TRRICGRQSLFRYRSVRARPARKSLDKRLSSRLLRYGNSPPDRGRRSPRPHRRCRTAWPDLGERWPSRLVATATADRVFDVFSSQFCLRKKGRKRSILSVGFFFSLFEIGSGAYGAPPKGGVTA